MKILKQINNTTMKVAKGMLAIFMIKVLLFSGVFVFQSCQTESLNNTENLKKEAALNNFKALVINNSTQIEKFIRDQNGEQVLARASNSSASSSIDNNVKFAVMPIVTGAKDLLLVYGISEIDLINVFGDSNSPKIALLGLLTLKIEMTLHENQSSVSMNSFFFNSLYAQSTLQVIDCALSALGLPAGLVLGSAKNLGRKAILKAAAKLAGRLVGWVGMAIAAYQFVRCLNDINPAAVSFHPPQSIESFLIDDWNDGNVLSLEDLIND